ncbi:MAG: Holliday junction resolvase RuvX [Flavobacteriales bacterium]
MPKYLGIDYGMKRCGLAITDSLGMIATAFQGVETREFDDKIPVIVADEKIDVVVFGMPKRLHGEENDMSAEVRKKKEWLQQKFPKLKIDECDERFTSKMAKDSMLEMGLKKKERRNKALVDEIAATILLQEYLQSLS